MNVTHILWREDGPEFVDLEQGGIDPENPNLEPIPEGLDINFVTFDSAARTIAPDPVAAERWAVEKIERDAEAASATEIQGLRRRIAISSLWEQIQRLKLAQATGNIPADLTERRKQFPTLMALVVLTGKTLGIVAQEAESRLWERVRRSALIEAKLMLAHNAVRAASGVAEKLAAANVVWED